MYYHEGERRGRRPQCDGPRDADKGGVPGLLGDRREMIAEPRDSVRMPIWLFFPLFVLA